MGRLRQANELSQSISTVFGSLDELILRGISGAVEKGNICSVSAFRSESMKYCENASLDDALVKAPQRQFQLSMTTGL
jgi:hypothetical protein